MTLTSRSLPKIRMILCLTLDQYLTTVQVSKEPIQGLRNYAISNNHNLDAELDINAMVTIIAVPKLLFKQAKNPKSLTYCGNLILTAN